MTHRHVFKLITDESGCPVCHYAVTVAIAKCECGEQIGPTEIERRLNATECLSAEDAMEAYGDGYMDNEYAEVQPWQVALLAYARAREGSDDDSRGA